MASIRERNGKFNVIYSYTNEKGERKQKWETYETKAEAKRRKKEIEYKKEMGSFVVRKCKTLDELITEYVALYGKENWALSTYEGNVSLINNYILPIIGDAKLSEIEGMYIPFFLYDFDCHYDIRATGSKIRTWRSGNYEYTETSLYQVERDATIDFEKLPVDASIAMPDEAMDLIEPYDYKALEDFQTKYMSGFLAEKYNMDATELGPRAKDKAKADSKASMNKTITGISTITNRTDNVTMDEKKADYALLPVWCYSYKYKGKDYLFKMNGQTGKIVGKPPVSWARVWGYGATVFGCTSAILAMIMLLAEVL